MSFCRRLALLATLAVVLSSAVMGQSGGKGGGTRTPPTTQPPMQPPMQTPEQMNRIIILSGNVVVDDGSPLPEPVAIEQVCNGRVTRQGRTDFKGYFSIDVGQFAMPVAESSAEDSGRSGSGPISSSYTGMPQGASTAQSLLGCELRGSLAGFRSSSVLIPPEDLGSGAAMVRVGTIVLQRMGQAQGSTVSATSLSAPKDAKKAYDKGHHAIEKNKLPQAQQDLEKAVQLYPHYAAAWLDLGWLHAQQGQLDKAREAFTQARTADDAFVPAYVGLASLAVRESKWQEAADMSARATQLDGVDFPAAFFYNSLANYRLGNAVEAEKSARKGETLGVQRSFPQVSLLLGVMLADRGAYVDAAEQLRAYLKAAPTSPNADKVRERLAEVEKLGGAGAKAEATTAK